MKVSIDDGEGRQGICKECFKRYNTKGSKNDIWYGWFDCSYPENARVKFSPWYYSQIKGNSPAAAAEDLTKKMEKMSVSAPAPAPSPSPLSKKEMLVQEIASMTHAIKNIKGREQVNMHKKLINLKTQLLLLKK